jgi:hypothetical protein
MVLLAERVSDGCVSETATTASPEVVAPNFKPLEFEGIRNDADGAFFAVRSCGAS